MIWRSILPGGQSACSLLCYGSCRGAVLALIDHLRYVYIIWLWMALGPPASYRTAPHTHTRTSQSDIQTCIIYLASHQSRSLKTMPYENVLPAQSKCRQVKGNSWYKLPPDGQSHQEWLMTLITGKLKMNAHCPFGIVWHIMTMLANRLIEHWLYPWDRNGRTAYDAINSYVIMRGYPSINLLYFCIWIGGVHLAVTMCVWLVCVCVCAAHHAMPAFGTFYLLIIVIYIYTMIKHIYMR